jgi:hypothetical protein
MDAVTETQASAINDTVATAKQWVSDAFRAGFALSDRDRCALRHMLAAEVRKSAVRFLLLLEAMTFREQSRASRHVASIRNARLSLRGAVARAKECGEVPTELLDACERLAR